MRIIYINLLTNKKGNGMKRISIIVLFLVSVGFSQNSEYIHFNKVIAKLENNRIVTGCWVSALHPTSAIGLVNFNGYPNNEKSISEPMIDFILIDMEHQPYDISSLRNFLLALNSKREVLIKGNLQPNIATLVRLPTDGSQPVHVYIKQALDVGVHGVVIPHVRTAEEAAKIVSACRYPNPNISDPSQPKGLRGASPLLAAYLWGLSMPEYVERADVWPLNQKGDLLAIIMIEDKDGVKNIESILKVKGIGAVIFGPYDYSFCVGHPGETTHPEVVKTWKKVKAACDNANVPLVGFANQNNINEILKENYKMLLIGHDIKNTMDIPKVIDVLKKKK
jgi:4-hydroxy-2-oxoheptanedioate aldolase